MTAPISRQALEEAVNWIADLAVSHAQDYPNLRKAAISGLNAILDGEPVEWCSVHGSERSITVCFRAKGRNLDPCQFETWVRVKVEP